MKEYTLTRCLQATYNALPTHDGDTLYYCKDTGNVYLGSKLLSDDDKVHINGTEEVVGIKTFINGLVTTSLTLASGNHGNVFFSLDSDTNDVIVNIENDNGNDVVMRGIRPPKEDNDAANKGYVDERTANMSDKADKVDGATSGNFAGLDASGNLTDSGKKASDFATAAQGAKADTAVQSVTVGATTTGDPGTKAEVTNSGTAQTPVLDFTIPRGADGADADNPFKGWYDYPDLPSEGGTGCYCYVQHNGVSTVYRWRGDNPGGYVDTQESVDASLVSSFKTAEEVNNVSIDDSHLSGIDSDDETNMPIIPKAIDVKQLRAKLDGVTAEEYRPNWVPVEGYKVKADGTLGSNSSASYTTIPLKGMKKIRFLGANLSSSSSSITKNTGYCLGHYNGAETESNWVIDQYWAYVATGTGSSSVVQEYIINIGANSPSTHLRTNCKYGAINVNNFYCFVFDGEKVVDLMENQKKYIESEGSIFRLVGNGTTQAISTRFPLMGGHKYRLTLRDENIDLTGTTEGLAATAVRLRVTTYENESDATSTGYLVLVTISETLSKTYEFTPSANCWVRLQMRAAVGVEQVFQMEDITNVPSVIDNVTSQSTTDALSANQGRIIGEKTQDIQFDGDILTTEDGTVTQNCFVNRTGKTTANSNCDVVTLDVGDYKTVRFLCVSPTFSNNANACYAFYNENNSLVGMPCVYSYNLSATSAKRYVVEIDVPSGAKYLKTLCRYYTMLTSAMFYCYGIKKNGIFDTVALMSTDNHETRIDIKALVEEDETGVVEKGYYTYSNNSFSSNTSYRTVKVNVPSNANYLYVNMRCRQACVYLYIFDSNDAILAKFGNPDASSAKTMSNIIDMSMYPTAAYIKVSSHNTTINNGGTDCVFSELPYTYSKYFFGDKLDKKDEGTGILDFNPDKEVLPKMLALRKTVRHSSGNSSVMSSESVVFGHISDCHGTGSVGSQSNKTWRRAMEFFGHWKDKGFIDDIVDTGDIVSGNWDDSIDWRTEAENVLTIIGNHDSSIPSAEAETAAERWLKHVGRYCYNRYLADNIGNWNVNQPDDAATDGKCYYYKNYVKEGYNESTSEQSSLTIRAIFLDVMGWGYGENVNTPSEAQKTWLEAQLQEARTNGHKVVIFAHYPPVNYARLDCSYSSYARGSWLAENADVGSAADYNVKYAIVGKIVHDFQLQGGIFLGYVCGHVHYECVGQIRGKWDFSGLINSGTAPTQTTGSGENIVDFNDERYPQLVFAVGEGNVSLKDNLYDYKMEPETKTNDNFQMVAFNAYNNTARLFKVGCNIDMWMRKKDCVSVNCSAINEFDKTRTNYSHNTRVSKDGYVWMLKSPVVENGETSWDLSIKELSSRVMSE